MSFKTHQAAFTQLGGLSELPCPLPGQSREGFGLQAVVNPNYARYTLGNLGVWVSEKILVQWVFLKGI